MSSVLRLVYRMMSAVPRSQSNRFGTLEGGVIMMEVAIIDQMNQASKALESSEATSKLSKATWRIYRKLIQSCHSQDKF